MWSNRLRIEKAPVLVGVLSAMCINTSLTAQETARVERGWLGFELVCTGCEYLQQGEVLVWTFPTPPMIRQIRQESPAANAGLQEGDTVLSIDGVDITTDAGGRLLGAIIAGQAVRLSIRRGRQRMAVAVTPRSRAEVFGEWHRLVQRGSSWDSLRAQVLTLAREQAKLQAALNDAEGVLQRTDAMRTSTEDQEDLLEQLRSEVDAIAIELESAQSMLRVQAESLAARTLWVAPSGPEREVTVIVPRPDQSVLSVYRNAVAGARFEELSAESPLLTYFPGVEHGLLVVKVVEGTPAYTSGLRDGDVVYEVNGESVKTVAELRRALQSSSEAELAYIRRGEKRTCKIPSKQ